MPERRGRAGRRAKGAQPSPVAFAGIAGRVLKVRPGERHRQSRQGQVTKPLRSFWVRPLPAETCNLFLYPANRKSGALALARSTATQPMTQSRRDASLMALGKLYTDHHINSDEFRAQRQ